MLRNKLFATTAAAAIAMAASASAATLQGTADNTDFDLSVGDFFTGTASLLGGQSVTYNFTALEDFTIFNFATAGTGFEGGEDLMMVRFGYGMAGDTGGLDGEFSQVFEFGSVASAVGSIEGRSFQQGDMFFFSFENLGDGTDANADLVGTTVSFDVAPIPVPAAGFLLVGALGAGALVARRKKKADA